jgi:glucose/mannose-6-phosphate isomerase
VRITVDEALLDNSEALAAADPGEMLRAVATAGAQVREAIRAAEEAGIAQIAADGRPRAVIAAGMGGSGIAGTALAAICGARCPVPVVPARGYTLPGWAGPMDLVAAVSCSGSTEETLAIVDEARRRGCRVLTVGAAESPLAELSERARGLHVAIDAGGRLPRANMWALTTPLLVAADALGLASVPAEVLAAAADLLDGAAKRCRPSSDSFVNPAKALALELAGSTPMIWGSSDVGDVAAYRFACQLNENAKLPAVFGGLPEVNHNQVVAFDGPYGVGARRPENGDDLFADRVEQAEATVGALRLVVLVDTEEHPQVARRREISAQVAADRGVPVSELRAEGSHPVERLASLVSIADFATVYLAVAIGVDPTPITPITHLKSALAAADGSG